MSRKSVQGYIRRLKSGTEIISLQKQTWFLSQRIAELLKEIEQLKSHISQMSCCCSGCGKHNLALEEKLEQENLVDG